MDTQKFNPQLAKEYVETEFDKNVLPTLMEYIKIPNLSKHFDPEWSTNGNLERAANLLIDWAKKQNVQGLQIELIQDKGRTPLILMEVAPTQKDSQTILMYGHYDKQPHFSGWLEGLGPTTPIIRDGKLYGRGGADDGYSLFGCIVALKAVQTQNVPHPRIVVLIEGDEESGSEDLPYYIDQLRNRIGDISLVICLDSGCPNYEQLCITTSLRGVVMANLKVSVLTEGVHSGEASGIVPSSFRIIRQLLERLENPKTGDIIEDFQVTIPPDTYVQTHQFSQSLGDKLLKEYPFVKGTQPVTDNVFQATLNRTWRAELEITGADGFPPCKTAGNVLRPQTTLKLSMRLPPTQKAEDAEKKLVEILTKDVPYGAHVEVTDIGSGQGWKAPESAPWLEDALQTASHNFFKKEAVHYGMGGSIPLMGLLGKMFPKSYFVITGVLGPQSNAHGPNEFLHLNCCKGIIGCMAQIIADSYEHMRKQ